MSSNTVPCRICSEPAAPFFTKQVLGRLTVAYFKCPACGQVQTETPYWLAEAYANLSFQRDVGMADRCIWTAQTTVALAYRLGVGPGEACLDWGGGTGLFTRVCRDYGLNFFYRDPYAQNIFAKGFEAETKDPGLSWSGVTAFEVAEHFPEPGRDFAELFQLSPRFILFSTLLYQDQGPDWWYFSADGQHVAFYTRKSLELLGQRFGYRLASNDCDLHLFSRERVSDRLLDSCRKSRERLARKYRKKHGTRILGDFEQMTRLLSAAPQSPAK